MPSRLVPLSVAELYRALERTRGSGWHLAGGRLLEGAPVGALPISPSLLPPGSGREIVLARIDVEETMPYARPLLQRSDLGRDFYFGDDTGRALVRVGDGGHAHPDVELHLDGEFAQMQAPPQNEDDEDDDENEDDEGAMISTYVRTIRTGDPVYVWGRASLRRDPDHAGYRDAPVEAVFSPSEMLHIYDEAAFRQLSAWRALPWYRKLSVMVRNR